ncbi:MAG: hypothetical protein Q7W54_17360 [Bacteroidota bacterium]|nr:hypothetical protein [Bacteroidota bacterium]
MKYCFLLICALFFISNSCTKQRLFENSFSIDFESEKTGKLTDRETKILWKGAQLLCGKKDFVFYKLGITPHPHFIANENGNQFLKIVIPRKFYGPITGAQWKFPFAPTDECFFSYRVKFEGKFDFAKGGKLPGLAGGTGNSGGNIPNGFDGWSARMMFWEKGKLSFYVYFPEQSSKWGERLYLKGSSSDTIRIVPGKWHTITQHVRMNTPGKADGILQGWFDGQEAFYTDSMLFRKDEKLKIDHIFYSIFLGGDDLSWTSAKDEYICFDDFRVSTQPLND